MWIQKQFKLQPRCRGFHLLGDEITEKISEISQIKVGLLHLFIQHTSASLAISENADPDVRLDMEAYFNHAIPENEPYYRHILEGADDMPAHIKSVVLGGDLMIPINNGRLNMGVWQGVYLCEHRDNGGGRNVVATINGE